MRLNKYIAHNTKYSRREADRLIEAGEVKINRQTVTDFGHDVAEEEHVSIKGKPVKPRKTGEVTVIIYNKPKGVLVTKRDDRGRATIYHKLPGKFRHFIPIGRLDFASEGLLLLTDAPEVAEVYMRSDMPRTYNIKIDKPLNDAMVTAMREGLHLEDARAGAHEKSTIQSMDFAPFAAYEFRGETGKYTKLRVTITEGKNRELRRFFAHFDAIIVDLKRIAYGEIELNNLPTNKTRFFSQREYDQLHDFLKKERKKKKVTSKTPTESTTEVHHDSGTKVSP
jgi:23S rRNA pseudouridine2605 synthase